MPDLTTPSTEPGAHPGTTPTAPCMTIAGRALLRLVLLTAVVWVLFALSVSRDTYLMHLSVPVAAIWAIVDGYRWADPRATAAVWATVLGLPPAIWAPVEMGVLGVLFFFWFVFPPLAFPLVPILVAWLGAVVAGVRAGRRRRGAGFGPLRQPRRCWLTAAPR